ncbi:hypothetical protein Hanom_Chr16g01514451 [Helianthus anomalus]
MVRNPATRLLRLCSSQYKLSKDRFFPSPKLQKSSFMYVTYCKLCPLSSIITENVPDVCKLLQVMSFSLN